MSRINLVEQKKTNTYVTINDKLDRLRSVFTHIYTTNLLLVDLGKNLRVSEQKVVLLSNLDGGASEGRNEHTVSSLDSRSDTVTVLVKSSGAYSKHVCLVELLDILLRNVDSRGSLSLGLSPLDQHTVKQRDNVLERLDGRLC